VPIQTLLFFTALSFLPAVLLLMTGFTRIVIVLSLLRQAMGTQAAPPNQVIVGMSLFLTFFVMGPTFDKVYDVAYKPFAASEITFEEALRRGEDPMRGFMMKQTRQADLQLFSKLAKLPEGSKAEQVPFRVLVPAFVTSELKSAFQIGFMIFIPVPHHRHGGGQRADEPGHDDAEPGADRPALQADAVRAGRRLEPAAGIAGRELCDMKHMTTTRRAALKPAGIPSGEGAQHTAIERAHMNPQQVLDAGQQGLMLMLMVSAPILIVVLVVGLLVSIFQAATQINEATLSFVPKVVAAVAVLAFAGPWMLQTLVDYLQRTLQGIPGAVG
jgi:flagellar biosynthetic protein FliP/flagellar biosynthetic protein FliQ